VTRYPSLPNCSGALPFAWAWVPPYQARQRGKDGRVTIFTVVSTENAACPERRDNAPATIAVAARRALRLQQRLQESVVEKAFGIEALAVGGEGGEARAAAPAKVGQEVRVEWGLMGPCGRCWVVETVHLAVMREALILTYSRSTSAKNCSSFGE
jgi:hypothetical protein